MRSYRILVWFELGLLGCFIVFGCCAFGFHEVLQGFCTRFYKVWCIGICSGFPELHKVLSGFGLQGVLSG